MSHWLRREASARLAMTNRPTINILAHAKQHAVGLLSLLVISSCAHKPTTPADTVYAGKLSYPVTKFQLKNGLSLKHVSGAPCSDESRPEVGTSDGSRTFSVYKLLADSGKELCECPSGLADPKYGGEFETYYRENDTVRVMQSRTGNTILITEDRSPTFPRIALLLMRKDETGVWHSSELLAPHMPGSPPNIYGHYLGAADITDSHIRFSTGQKQWSETFEKVTKHAEPNMNSIQL